MTSNVVPFGHEAAASVHRVASVEARWIHLAEIETAEVIQGWSRGPGSLCSRINALDHALREKLDQHAVVHAQHLAHGFDSFRPKFPRTMYWVVLGLAAALETPLNNSALGLLMMDDVETAMVAGSLAILNVLAASLVGWKIRQAPWSLAGLRDWLVTVVMLLVCLTTMFGLGGLRMDDLIHRSSEAGLQVGNAPYATFIAIQLLFFAVGAFFSYSMHPSDAALERLLKEKQTLRRQVDTLLGLRSNLVSQHDRALGHAKAAIEKLRAECMARIAEYRDFNMATRSTAAPPWLRASLDSSVFEPVDLGSSLADLPPTLAELLRSAMEVGVESQRQDADHARLRLNAI